MNHFKMPSVILVTPLVFSLGAVAQTHQVQAGQVQAGQVQYLPFEHAVPATAVAGHNVLFQTAPTEGIRQFAMEFVGGEFGVSGKVVKNAPYSAEAITETSQTLADGNRIRHKSSTQVYRDSQGRTRRESVFGAVGLAPDLEMPKLVFISDPVAGFSYVLNLKDRTATKNKIGAPNEKISVLHSKIAQDARHVEVNVEAGDNVRRTEVRTFTRSVGPVAGQDAKTETLPRQNIEGVLADGTRTTFSIPAGKIGNDRPIEIVSERWYSPELQTVVSTRHIDPRAGENNFRLTNISRSEPAPSLFEVPADFKVKEESGDVFRLRVDAPTK